MRSRAPLFTLKNGLAVLILALLGIWTWMGLGSCRSDRVSVNPKDPQSPQYAYRQDELALLSLMADDIQELERKKQYATIYDDYASQEFKNSISRRRFLIISNCVESFLGGMDPDGYDPHDLGFRREDVKGASSKYLDVLNRKVHRMMGLVDEQMVFVPHDLNFKLNGLYWISKDKQFLQCVAESPNREQDGQPASMTDTSTETAPTGSEEQKASENGADTGQESEKSSETGTKPTESQTENQSAGQPTGGSETTPTETTGRSDSGTETQTRRKSSGEAMTPVIAPVQEMKPAEARKATVIHARPAGAGAVIDQRPSAPVVRGKNQTSGGESDSNQGHAPIPTDGDNADKHRSDTGRDASQTQNAPIKQSIPSSIPPLKQNSEPPTPTPPASH